MGKTVWCISKYASPPKYGVGARLFYVAREFKKLGLDVVLISSDSNHLAQYPESSETYNFEEYDGLSHIWIKTRKYARSASVGRLLSWLDFEIKLFRLKRSNFRNPDIVIVSSLSLLTIIYGIYLKKRYACKLVFEVRDIYPLTLTEELKVHKWNPIVVFLGLIEKLGYMQADLIAGTMPNLSQHVQETIGVRCEVFHSPVGIQDIWHGDPLESSSTASLFPTGKAFVVGYAGSMGVTNALEAFIEAITQLSDREDVCFVFVGEGDLKETYAKRLSGFTNVRFGPRIPQAEIPGFLSRCNLLYLSTHDSKIWAYGQSLNKLTDYMMSGKPVLASYSGYPSMLNEANSGWFVPVGDVGSIREAILAFKDMPESERHLYGERGRKWIEDRYSYENIAQQYLQRILELFP